MEVDGLADELLRQKEECRKQHEELAILGSKLQYAESQINKVSNVVWENCAHMLELSSNVNI